MADLDIRPARADEVEQLVDLCASTLDETDVPSLRFDIEQEGVERFTVAVDRGRVVSSLSLLSRSLLVGEVTLPVGVIEYVMTRPEYRRRGLVRAQVDLAHRWSAERGDLLGLIVGIPYLYRRFGYGYALAQGPRYQLRRGVDVSMPPGWSTREAAPGDEEALASVHDAAQRAADIALARPAEHWSFMVRSLPDRAETMLVAEHDGVVGGYGRIWEAASRNFVFEAGARSLTAAKAVLAGCVGRGDPLGFSINDRPGTPISTLLVDVGMPLDRPYETFVRVPDVVALLDRLRPVLSARLAASDLAADTEEVRLNTYTAVAVLRCANGTVAEVSAAEPVEEPGPGLLSVPPDLLPALLLGSHDALALEAANRDVDFGGRRALARTLFPRLVSNVIWPA